MKSKIEEVKKRLDSISPSFCPAKWLQVTLHLENGHNHSCHHPDTHKAKLAQVIENPSALHNTEYKLSLRNQMLEGRRPAECNYCWKMEDASSKNISDRLIKASDSWAVGKINSIAQLNDSSKINPTYLEVSFDSICNLRCMYCGPHISSSLMWEYQRFGNYRFMETLEEINAKEKISTEEEKKIYTDAFWKWFPDLMTDLQVLRVTGGEPLLSGNTFKLIKELKKYNCSNLTLSINSNLAIPDAPYNKFIKSISELINGGSLKGFALYASIDSYGKQAEYVRFGLDSEEFFGRARDYLKKVDAPLVFMITYNILAATSFDQLLRKIAELKNEHGEQRVIADISMLNYPHFLTPRIASEDIVAIAQRSLDLMNKLAFNSYEVEKFSRIIRVMVAVDNSDSEVQRGRGDFTDFIPIYDKRKGTNFNNTFPELVETYNQWKRLYGEKK